MAVLWGNRTTPNDSEQLRTTLTPGDPGRLRTTPTTPNDSKRLRTTPTPGDSGRLRTIPDDSGPFRTIPNVGRFRTDIAARTYLPESIPNLSESDLSRLRIFANFTHHYYRPSRTNINCRLHFRTNTSSQTAIETHAGWSFLTILPYIYIFEVCPNFRNKLRPHRRARGVLLFSFRLVNTSHAPPLLAKCALRDWRRLGTWHTIPIRTPCNCWNVLIETSKKSTHTQQKHIVQTNPSLDLRYSQGQKADETRANLGQDYSNREEEAAVWLWSWTSANHLAWMGEISHRKPRWKVDRSETDGGRNKRPPIDL